MACFFAGGGAAKFIRDYAAAGLKDKIPLYGSGFLTEGVLDAAGPAADGIMTTMHYSDSLDTPRNKQFRLAYAKTFKHAARRVRGAGLRHRPAAGRRASAAVKGDIGNKQALYKAMETPTIDSPRGKWTMSKAHNPVQDIYLRQVENKENKVIGIAAKALADSGAGCKHGLSRGSRLAEWAEVLAASATFLAALAPAACTSLDGLRQLPDPAAQQRAVRAAAVHAGRRPDADLRHHGRGQPRARQLLHAGRLPGLVAVQR